MTHTNEMNNIIEERYKEIATLTGHTGWVLCLTHYKNTLVFCGVRIKLSAFGKREQTQKLTRQ